jgi:hypothetical protein
MSGVAESTLWHRHHGRVSIQETATTQQYLSPQEEQALVNYFIRSDQNGYPLPVKFSRSLAHIIALRRDTIFAARILTNDDNNTIKPPGKNWPQALEKHHAEMKAV